jgi:hypothetical protein
LQHAASSDLHNNVDAKVAYLARGEYFDVV